MNSWRSSCVGVVPAVWNISQIRCERAQNQMVDATKGCVRPRDGKVMGLSLPGGSKEIRAVQSSDESEHVRPVQCGDATLAEFGVERDDLLNTIGVEIAKTHLAYIIHGDPRNSNMMLRKGSKIWSVPIDFGFMYHSTMVEDKAIGLYVLDRAFGSTHPDAELLFSSVQHLR
ncbi:hypothetical protein EDC04DRAFT_2900265 [Pisolithus marmoratus]|nr:hypothetical protein EDC04DRAFT_2900265 [Pisolithus marmoratus]